MDKKTEEKNLLKNSVKCIIAVLVVIGIGYLIITFSKKGLEQIGRASCRERVFRAV